jgi:hypothetical protein
MNPPKTHINPMPRFFDKNNLSPERQSRWDSAVSEYLRVQSANLDQSLNKMTLAQKLEVVDDTDIPEGVTLEDFVRDRLTAFNCCRPGDEKSALFARLLDGKSALPSPPPTYFSYPWYDVVEGDGPFPVMIGGVDQSKITDESSATRETKYIIIGQAAWNIVSMNEDALKLLSLEESLRSTLSVRSTGPGPYDKESVFGWTPSLISMVEAVYQAGPEIVVQHGAWGPYRLKVGRSESTCILHYARMVQAQGDGARVPMNVGSVFDSSMLMIDLQIGDTISKGPDLADEIRKAEDAVSRSKASGAGMQFAEMHLKALQNEYLERAKKREDEPDRDDWVKITTLGWVLERF